LLGYSIAEFFAGRLHPYSPCPSQVLPAWWNRNNWPGMQFMIDKLDKNSVRITY